MDCKYVLIELYSCYSRRLFSVANSKSMLVFCLISVEKKLPLE